MKTAWLCIVLLASGCALTAEREKRFMPEPTLPPSVEATFVADCTKAITDARDNASKVEHMAEVCSALSAVRCGAWLDRNILAENGILMKDSTANAAGALATMAAAAFDFSPGGVAAVGFAQMLAHLVGQVEKTGLGAPESFTAQSTMMAAQATCSANLTKTKPLSFSAAIIGLDRCRRFCSSGAASAITTKALDGVEVETTPTGRLMLRRAP